MPDIPTALPDKVKIRALIRERGYKVTDVARLVGCPPSSIYDLTGRRNPLPRGVPLLRQVARVLSTRAKPVRISDISDWTGDDDTDTGIEPAPSIPAA